jgi:ZIP family zinc transporter
MNLLYTMIGVLIPFFGTAAGAAAVFLMRRGSGTGTHGALSGFAGGIMTAASVWSLLLPAIEQSGRMGLLAFLPATVGFWAGTLFVLILDRLALRLRVFRIRAEAADQRLRRTAIMILTVTIHNLPEGMAVGVMFAGLLSGSRMISLGGAMALSIGIAIQNLPEGAIVSLPLRAHGRSRTSAFLGGMLSGVVEPIGAAAALLAARFFIPAMPYFLSFAAGAMLCVVARELIPAASDGEGDSIGALCFSAGFSLMMALDVALG